LRIVLVRKVDEQRTALVSPLYAAPGEHRRSGFEPRLQPLVFVRSASRTVPRRGVGVGVLVGGGLLVVVVVLSSQVATPPWWEQLPEWCCE